MKILVTLPMEIIFFLFPTNPFVPVCLLPCLPTAYEFHPNVNVSSFGIRYIGNDNVQAVGCFSGDSCSATGSGGRLFLTKQDVIMHEGRKWERNV